MNTQQTNAFKRYGRICECYFGLGMPITHIAITAGCTAQTVSKAIDRYFLKPEHTIVLQSKLNTERLRRLMTTDIIFDNQTGIYYNNRHDLAIAINKNYRTLCSYLNGTRNQKQKRFIKT